MENRHSFIHYFTSNCLSNVHTSAGSRWRPVKLSPRHIIQTFAVYNHLVLLFPSVISSFVFVYGFSSVSSFCTSATPSCEHEQFMEVSRVILHLHYSYMWYQTTDGDNRPSRIIQHLHNFFTCYLTWWRRMLNVVLHLHYFFYFGACNIIIILWSLVILHLFIYIFLWPPLLLTSFSTSITSPISL